MTRQEEIFYKVLENTKNGKIIWRRIYVDFQTIKDGEFLVINGNYVFQLKRVQEERKDIFHREFIIPGSLLSKSEDQVLSGNIKSGSSVRLQEDINLLCSIIEEKMKINEEREFYKFMSGD